MRLITDCGATLPTGRPHGASYAPPAPAEKGEPSCSPTSSSPTGTTKPRSSSPCTRLTRTRVAAPAQPRLSDHDARARRGRHRDRVHACTRPGLGRRPHRRDPGRHRADRSKPRREEIRRRRARPRHGVAPARRRPVRGSTRAGPQQRGQRPMHDRRDGEGQVCGRDLGVLAGAGAHDLLQQRLRPSGVLRLLVIPEQRVAGVAAGWFRHPVGVFRPPVLHRCRL